MPSIVDLLDWLDGIFDADGRDLTNEAAEDNIGDWYAIAAAVSGLISNPKRRDRLQIESAQRDISLLHESLSSDFQSGALPLLELRGALGRLGNNSGSYQKHL